MKLLVGIHQTLIIAILTLLQKLLKSTLMVQRISNIYQFPDGNLLKIKNSTIFPEGWSDIKIIDSITDIGNSPPISIRGRDGATFHRGIVNGV